MKSYMYIPYLFPILIVIFAFVYPIEKKIHPQYKQGFMDGVSFMVVYDSLLQFESCPYTRASKLDSLLVKYFEDKKKTKVPLLLQKDIK